MSALVRQFLDSVMQREAKLSDANSGKIKCKRVWDLCVQLECIKKAIFIIACLTLCFHLYGL